MNDELTKAIAERLIRPVTELRTRALTMERAHAHELTAIAPGYQNSARNLLHYLAVRQTDIREVQRELSSLGLSSLAAMEAHTLSTLNSVLVVLCHLAERDWSPPIGEKEPVDFWTGPMFLANHSRLILGSPSGKRTVRIMVTMPTEAATNPRLVRDLLASGMDVMRINCAHDDQDAWLAMIHNLHMAERELGRSCKVYADLAGPKLRTGPVEVAGHIVRLRPLRNHRGEVVMPARVWLTPADAAEPPPADIRTVVPMERSLLERSIVGDTVEIQDARGKKRVLTVTSVEHSSRLAEADRTAYVEAGSLARLYRERELVAEGEIGQLPAVILPIRVSVGDTLILTPETELGRPARRGEDGAIMSPARIPCTLPEAFGAAQRGERIWFDDGKIGGVVVDNNGREIAVEIIHSGPQGGKLRPEKGINLPDTHLSVPALTSKDLADLELMVKHVDMVGLSFVREPDDIYLLEKHLVEMGASHIGVVLKIENREAFENLPRLLLASLRSPPVAVMVARGDLAVEVGFERLAEVQEEILWLCEAAHVPVIWATQVLETLAKSGMPSRSEVSDAVMSGRAECVMLNKGPYVVEAVHFLNGVLERMEAHLSKTRTMLRKLAISELHR